MTQIPENYQTALTAIQEETEKYDIDWAVTGSVGRALQGMEFTEGEPEDIDIVLDRAGLETLYGELQEYSTTDIQHDSQIEVGEDQLNFYKFEAEIEGIEIEFLGEFEANGEPVYGDYNPEEVEVQDV